MPAASPPIFKTWIIFTIASMVLSFVAGAIVGAILGASMAIAGYNDPTLIGRVCAGAGFLVSLPVNFLTFSWAVKGYLLAHCSSEPEEGIDLV